MKTANVAIFASGNGSNAKQIIEHFKGNQQVKVKAVFTNKREAGVVDIAKGSGLPIYVFTREDFYNSDIVMNMLAEAGITHIVLAGFLWLIPTNLIQKYTDKIINIHPALLPRYGGKGMYGMHVHKAVKAAGEKEAGITIHLVNENYDEGKYLVQKKLTLSGSETEAEIAEKVQVLEHTYFPQAIEDWIKEGY